jgi:hypothetical protein
MSLRPRCQIRAMLPALELRISRLHFEQVLVSKCPVSFGGATNETSITLEPGPGEGQVFRKQTTCRPDTGRVSAVPFGVWPS